MEFKPDINVVLERLGAFWRRDMLDHPPIRVRYPIACETGEEWQRSVETHEGHYTYWEKILRERSVLGDDEVPTATLDLGPGHMPAIMGAELRFTLGTSWASHILEDWDDFPKLPRDVLAAQNHWLTVLKERAAVFEELAKGKCAVGVAMLTGPGDIAAALRGVTNFGMDLAMGEDETAELLDICTEAFIAVSQSQMDWITPLQGGYCDNYGIWTPGRSGYFADDVSTMISPQMYRERLFDYDCRIAGSFEHPWLHVHSDEARLVPEFVKIPSLKAIQIVNDAPAGPTIEQILPHLQQVQENHCLILRKYTMEDLAPILPSLNPDGLYIDTQCGSLEEAKSILSDWKKGVPWNKPA